jgi:hypothetical protein
MTTIYKEGDINPINKLPLYAEDIERINLLMQEAITGADEMEGASLDRLFKIKTRL